MGLRPEAAAAGAERGRLTGGRWLLVLPLAVAGAALYALNFSSEMRYRSPQAGSALVPFDGGAAPPLRALPPGFVVDSAGCRIPALDPWDPLVRPYVEPPEPLRCARRGRQLVRSDMAGLRVRTEALPDYNASSAADLACCYTPFYRPAGDPKHSNADDRVRFANFCVPFQVEAAVSDAEFVRVRCSAADEVVYEDYHAFVPRKAAVEARSRAAAGRWGGADPQPPSVLLLGIDAVSRLNLHRQMPRTVALLRGLGAVEMLGYNKVGDNTFPNMVPVLAGLSETQLRNACWPTDKSSFDACPFVWNDFRGAGYRTAFGEDAPWMGMFNYVKRGFAKQPTDYYLRPFAKTAEDEIGHTKKLNAKMCVGSRLTAEVQLEYVNKFLRTFKDDRTFALFWGASLSHDYLNYPSLGDGLYEGLLSGLRAAGVLERTILVFLSDHGIRWGGIRETYQGRLEERLPFLFLLFPPGFRERYPAAVANAARNARRLSTPFDVHETLLDALRPAERLAAAAVRRRSAALAGAAGAGPPRGISLFLQLPAERTCEQAAIDPHWCTCQQSRPADTASEIVNRTAAFVLRQLNALVRPYRQCARLSLGEVRSAQVEEPQERLRQDTTRESGLRDYVLVLRTEPGGALFEATVRHRAKDDSLALAGAVSRINTYGQQSACVANYHIKLYCYCSS